MGRAKLTRRQQSQYQSIVREDGSTDWAYPGPGSPHWWMGNQVARSNGWSALTFAKRWGRRDGVDLKRLQRIVLRSGDPDCAYQFARDVPGANVRRLQRVVVEGGDPRIMRAFAKNILGADVQHLEAMIMIGEVMGT